MSGSWPATPPTRILSWQQLVLEADPDWNRKLTRPWIYEMSSGRLFYAPNPLYGAYDISDFSGDFSGDFS